MDLRLGLPDRDRTEGGPGVTQPMTLGEATELLTAWGWPCGCSGPGPWPNCGCGRLFTEARALQRGAHIAAKQVADLAARRSQA
jgi:hypothetical protein